MVVKGGSGEGAEVGVRFGAQDVTKQRQRLEVRWGVKTFRGQQLQLERELLRPCSLGGRTRKEMWGREDYASTSRATSNNDIFGWRAGFNIIVLITGGQFRLALVNVPVLLL